MRSSSIKRAPRNPGGLFFGKNRPPAPPCKKLYTCAGRRRPPSPLQGRWSAHPNQTLLPSRRDDRWDREESHRRRVIARSIATKQSQCPNVTPPTGRALRRRSRSSPMPQGVIARSIATKQSQCLEENRPAEIASLRRRVERGLPGKPPSPSSNRTCGFPASGSPSNEGRNAFTENRKQKEPPTRMMKPCLEQWRKNGHCLAGMSRPRLREERGDPGTQTGP